MRSRWILCDKVLLLVVVPVLINLGCEDASVIEVVGPTLPLSNQRIVNQSTHGTPGQNSSIWGLYDDGSRGIYFKGRIDGNYVVGKFSNTGQIIWSNIQADRVRGIFPVPDNTIGLAEGIVWVGGHDTDGDDRANEARIGLTGAGGVEIDEWLIARPDTVLWFNAVDRINHLTFVAVGGVMITDDEYYPYVATFEIGPDSSLVVLNEKIFDARHKEFYVGVKIDPGKVSGGAFTCYTTVTRGATDTEPEQVAVQAFHGSTTDVSAYDIDWTVDLAWSEPLNMWTYLDAIALFDGSVYIAGAGNVIKENESGSGSQWTAGFIGSVSTSGALNWLHVISLSKYHEKYYNLRVTSDALYAVGTYGHYSTSPDSRNYGLALISVFDRANGGERYHIGFGGTDYSSGFDSMLLKDPHAVCVGWTNHSTPEAGAHGWFTEVDLEAIRDVGAQLLPEMPAVEARADSPGKRVSRGDDDRGGGR